MLKSLIWIYIILLIFEGSLRKWVLPSLSDPLLIARDPVAIGIYLLALASGVFPFNGYIVCTFALAALSMVASFLAGQDNLMVMAYGLRINYGHLPLIWVIGRVLSREDVERIGSFLLLVAIPMTLLMVLQFKSPINAPINRGIGGDEGGQIYGAAGRIRPPGFFSFITGPQIFYPFVAAFFLYQASSHRRLWWLVLIAAGLAILVAIPVSISRTVLLATGIVVVAFVITLPFARGSGGGTMVRAILMSGVVAFGVSFLPIFSESRAVFLERWDTAAVSTQGDAWGGIVGRILAGFTQPFYWAAKAPLFGHGIGVGSNVGATLLAGKLGFLLAEDEWGKIFSELGPVLGGAFILFRIIIAFRMGMSAVQALLQRRDNLPILIFSASVVPIVQNQWAPPTILGFAVLGGGLVLASLKEREEDEDDLEEEDDEEEDNEEDLDADETEASPSAPDSPGPAAQPTRL